MKRKQKVNVLVWNAPTKEEKQNNIWESIKADINSMKKNETNRNEKHQPTTLKRVC